MPRTKRDLFSTVALINSFMKWHGWSDAVARTRFAAWHRHSAYTAPPPSATTPTCVRNPFKLENVTYISTGTKFEVQGLRTVVHARARADEESQADRGNVEVEIGCAIHIHFTSSGSRPEPRLHRALRPHPLTPKPRPILR